MYKEYQPNEQIVDHAVELWVDLLRKPVYDNGDRSFTGVMTTALLDQMPKNNDEETLARFGQELRKILLAPLEWESSRHDGTIQKYTTLFNDLDVDYHPNIPLAEAAKRSGLKMEFPIKTQMWLREEYLTFAVGYGAPTEYHYPLADGTWLVTKLSGDDISKVIALVESGLIDRNLETAR